MEIGRNIRKLRKQRGITLRQLAELAGIRSFSYIANIERGEIEDPSLKAIMKIAKAFDVSIDDLVNMESIRS